MGNTFINVEVPEELSRKERPRSWPLANSKSVPRGGAPLHLEHAQRTRRKKTTSRDRRIEVAGRRASPDVVVPSMKDCTAAIVPAATQAAATGLNTGLVAPKAVREGAWHLCNVALGVESRLLQEAFREWSGRPGCGLEMRGVTGKTTKAAASAAVICNPSTCSKIIIDGDGCNAGDIVKVVKYELPDGADEKVVPRAPVCVSPCTVAPQRRRRCLDNDRALLVMRKPWRASFPSSLVLAIVVLLVALLCRCLAYVCQDTRPYAEMAADGYQALDTTIHRSSDEAVEGASGFSISGPERHPRQTGANAPVGRGILGTSSLGMLEGLGESTTSSDRRTLLARGSSLQLPSLAWGGSGERPSVETVARGGASFNQVKSPRAEKAMRAIIEEMNRFTALQPQLQGLPQHVFLEIASRAEELDNVLFKLQRRGNELQALAARGGFGTVHLESEGQQFVMNLEKFAATQAAFMNEVEKVTRTRRLHGGYVAYRPKDLR